MTETEEPQAQPAEEKQEDDTVPGSGKHPDYGHDEERYEPENPTPDQIADPTRSDETAEEGELDR